MDITIREWMEADTARVLDIAIAAWTPVYAGYERQMGKAVFAVVHAEWQERKKQVIMESCRRRNGVVVYVAELAGNIAGFVGCHLDGQRCCGTIYDNAVAPEYQGRGVASAMYSFVLGLMKQQGMEVATVYTGGDEAHAPARRAYEKCGFSVFVPAVRYYMELE